MSEAQARRAIERLYEDTNSRDELTDDEANVLLKWSESQIKAIAARDLDDETFDETVSHLRKMTKNVNRFTGQRAYKSPEELTVLLDEIATEAQALGVNVQAAQLAVPQAQAADDNIALIQAMTAILTPSQSQSAAVQAAPAQPAAPPEAVPPPATDQPAAQPTEEPEESESLWDKLKKLF
jgi:hypothetical protein